LTTVKHGQVCMEYDYAMQMT